jgi:hypothetical protein
MHGVNRCLLGCFLLVVETMKSKLFRPHWTENRLPPTKTRQPGSVLPMFLSAGNPFSLMPPSDRTLPSPTSVEGVFANQLSTVFDLLFERAKDIRIQPQTPVVVTQSCITLVSFIGKYLQLMYVVENPVSKVAVFNW